MQRTEKKKRRILCIAAITVSFVLFTGIRYQNGADGKETPEILLDFPDAIRQQCQKLEEMRADFLQETAQKEEEKEEPEEVREASLVEQISDPTLRMYSWSTPGLVDPPYCSYAQEEGLDASEFGYMPEAGLGGEEAAEWGGRYSVPPGAGAGKDPGIRGSFDKKQCGGVGKLPMVLCKPRELL